MAETIFVRGEAGTVFAMDLPLHEAISERLKKGLLTRVDKDGNPVKVDDEVAAPASARPALNASQADWAGWAVTCGADPEAASGMSRGDLIEKYGTDVPPVE